MYDTKEKHKASNLCFRADQLFFAPTWNYTVIQQSRIGKTADSDIVSDRGHPLDRESNHCSERHRVEGLPEPLLLVCERIDGSANCRDDLLYG